MKMKTNSNSLHKPEYRTYNLIVQLEESFLKVTKITCDDEFDINFLKQYYTGKHIQIWEYLISKKNKIRRVYLNGVHIKYNFKILNILIWLSHNYWSRSATACERSVLCHGIMLVSFWRRTTLFNLTKKYDSIKAKNKYWDWIEYKTMILSLESDTHMCGTDTDID